MIVALESVFDDRVRFCFGAASVDVVVEVSPRVVGGRPGRWNALPKGDDFLFGFGQVGLFDVRGGGIFGGFGLAGEE